MRRFAIVLGALALLLIVSAGAEASQTPSRHPPQSSIAARAKAAETKAAKLEEASYGWSAKMDQILAKLDEMLAKIRSARKKIGG